ncbi:MAG: EF-P beta-lysylation protein EpmB [Pseudohongiellaceae bacterium]
MLKIISTQQSKSWQEILSELVTDPSELVSLLELDVSLKPLSLLANDQFPLKVPMPFVQKIAKGDWNDPLLRQIWPSRDEEEVDLTYVSDPLAEAKSNPVSGLLHKYHGRVLLTAAPHCAIHCRYCFRRHFDYEDNAPSRKAWQDCFDYITSDASIEEVILSGGDPLALADKQFGWLLEQIELIPHVNTVRIHSRLPLVIPQRITTELLQLLSNRRVNLVLVIHCNHAAELCRDSMEGLRTLAANGVTMLNQSVVLADVNDNVQDLSKLSRKLFSAGVLPYYLHLPDEVAGTKHFDVKTAKAKELIRAMQTRLPGYLVPKLVKEEAGKPAKTRIA